MELQGGCQCGRIRYRAAGPGELASVCYCRMCQLASGGPFMVFVRFAVRTVSWSTPPETFASSDLVQRGFCKACGTPLSYHRVGGPHISLTRNSLDDPDAARPPEVSLMPQRKAGWLAGLDSLPVDDDDPPAGPVLVSHQSG